MDGAQRNPSFSCCEDEDDEFRRWLNPSLRARSVFPKFEYVNVVTPCVVVRPCFGRASPPDPAFGRSDDKIHHVNQLDLDG
jgi:hypothetical protein